MSSYLCVKEIVKVANQEVKPQTLGTDYWHNFYVLLIVLFITFLPAFIFGLIASQTYISSNENTVALLAGWRSLGFLLAVLQKWIVYAAVTRWMFSGRPASPEPTETACCGPPCPVSWLRFPGSFNPKGHQSQSLKNTQWGEAGKMFRFIVCGQTSAAKQLTYWKCNEKPL